MENSTYLLTCNLFSGAKPIFFEWNKNGQKFSGTTNVRMENTNHYSLLTMTGLTAADSATYECIAKNAYGTASTSTQFVIKGLTEEKNHIDETMLSSWLKVGAIVAYFEFIWLFQFLHFR